SKACSTAASDRNAIRFLPITLEPLGAFSTNYREILGCFALKTHLYVAFPSKNNHGKSPLVFTFGLTAVLIHLAHLPCVEKDSEALTQKCVGASVFFGC
ncbi:MAG: hypothetical protein ACK5Q1_05240, partial [Limnobacter sp.]